jgi:hypothetical protein
VPGHNAFKAEKDALTEADRVWFVERYKVERGIEVSA